MIWEITEQQSIKILLMLTKDQIIRPLNIRSSTILTTNQDKAWSQSWFVSNNTDKGEIYDTLIQQTISLVKK